MFELNTTGMQDHTPSISPPRRRTLYPPRQQRLMATALSMLLVALAFVLYRERDFWFPDDPQAEDQPQDSIVAAATPAVKAKKGSARHKKSQNVVTRSASDLPQSPAEASDGTSIIRTALPPLE